MQVKPSNLLDKWDWAVFLSYLREESPSLSSCLMEARPSLSWDGTLRVCFSKAHTFHRELVDKRVEQFASHVNKHFGERVVRVEVQQEV